MKKRKSVKKTACVACLAMLVLTAACGAKSEDMAMNATGGSYWGGMDFESPNFVTAEEAKDYYVNASMAASDGWSGNKTGAVASPAVGGTISEEEMTSVLSASTRKTIRTANLTLETLEFDRFLTAIEEQITAVGGYTEYANVSGNAEYNRRRSASYTIRVPQERLDMFLDGVDGIATVVSKVLSEKDVTLDYVDTESRIATLKVEQERLLALLEKAESLEAIIMLENRLSDVRYSIESHTSRLRAYDSQITYSTVSVSVSEVLRVTPQEPKTLGERISSGFSDTIYDITTGLQDFCVWFIVNLPYLIFRGAVIAVIVVAICKITKKRKQKKAEKRLAAEAAAKEKENSGQ